VKLKFGRIYAPDARDRAYQLAARNSLRRSRAWRDDQWFGDQADSQKCVGFAWAHWLSASPVSQWLDPAGLYELARYVDEWEGEDYEGTSIRAGAKVLQLLGFFREYHWASQLDLIVSALLERGPVVMGTHWYTGMLSPDPEGFIAPWGNVLGGHAYLLTAVDGHAKRVRVKNSWSRAWGDNGHAWLSFHDLEQLLSEDGEACIGVECTPRPNHE
jgi:hypothetical protein